MNPSSSETKVKRVGLDNRAALLPGALFLVVVALRHAGRGVDLWDAGYNAGNFAYLYGSTPERGLGALNPMWYCATYLSNLLGHGLALLPGGDTYLGLQIYSGLLMATPAVMGFLWAVRRFKLPYFPVLAGEAYALFFAWTPSVVLYDHLGFLLLNLGVILLWEGLEREKSWLLAAAGVCLGLNPGVRFPNLAQTALILVLWLFVFLTGKKGFRTGQVLRKSLYCLLGFCMGLVLFLLLFVAGSRQVIPPGQSALAFYLCSVRELFSMGTSEYSVGSMMLGLGNTFLDEKAVYLGKRILLVLIPLVAAGLVLERIPEGGTSGKGASDEKASGREASHGKRILRGILPGVYRIVCISGIFFLGVWLWKLDAVSPDPKTYQVMHFPLLYLTGAFLLLCIYGMVRKGAKPQERVMSFGLLLLTWLGSVGSNTYFYAVIDNLYLLIPGGIWLGTTFWKDKGRLWYVPLKAALVLLTAVVLLQGARFGFSFVYEEATGGRDFTGEIREVPALKGMHTTPERAEELEQLYRMVQEVISFDAENEGQLPGVILQGEIPALAYAMELEPAFCTWSELNSYQIPRYEKVLTGLEERISADSENAPLLLATTQYSRYFENGTEDGIAWGESGLRKASLMKDFVEACGYEIYGATEHFVLYYAP